MTAFAAGRYLDLLMPRLLKAACYIAVLLALGAGGWFLGRNWLTEREYRISKEAGKTLLEQGSFAEAAAQLEASLEAARKLGDAEGERVDEVLEDLADAYSAQGAYVQTQHLYFEALSRRVEKHGPVHPKVAEAFTELGGSYERQASYEVAEGMYNQAIDVWTKLGLSSDPASVPARVGLARVLEQLGRAGEAARHYQQALEIEEGKLGRDSPELAPLLRRYAAALEKAGEQGKVEGVLSRLQRLAPAQ